VVAAGVLVLISLPPIIAAWPVHAQSVPLDQLAVRMSASAGVPYQGFAVSSGTAGLPTLPQLSDVIDLLNGETQLRVWYAGPERWRVDQIDAGSEVGLYQQPGDQVRWDFGTNQVTTIVGDQPIRLPSGIDLLPPDLGRRILSLVDPSTASLSALPAKRVAGIAAAGLRITPEDAETTVGQVDLWADPATGLPLQVEVTGKGASAPVLVTRFLDLDYTAPTDGVLVPPRGGATTGHVFTDGADISRAFRSLRPGPLPDSLGGAARTDTHGTVGLAAYGSGLTRFLVITVPRRVGFDAYDRAVKAGGVKVSLPGGDGVIVRSSLLTVMAMDSDPARRTYLLVGLVDTAVLKRAGSELSTFVGGDA
jgi:hypothetical protein